MKSKFWRSAQNRLRMAGGVLGFFHRRVLRTMFDGFELLTQQIIKRGGWSQSASAELKFIFHIRKSFNSIFFDRFSRFFRFPNFSWFLRFLTFKIDSEAWFPARGSFQIAQAWSIKPIQIFVFMLSSYANCLTLNTRSTKFYQTWHRH